MSLYEKTITECELLEAAKVINNLKEVVLKNQTWPKGRKERVSFIDKDVENIFIKMLRHEGFTYDFYCGEGMFGASSRDIVIYDFNSPY